MHEVTHRALDEDGVAELGAALGGALEAGDVVALVGPLGAGKSAFARAALYGAGVERRLRIASPTFTIVQEYAGRIPLFHADLYRLASIEELDETGLIERALDGAALIEWADRFTEALPREALWIELRVVDETRRALHAWGEGEAARRLVAALG